MLFEKSKAHIGTSETMTFVPAPDLFAGVFYYLEAMAISMHARGGMGQG